MKIDLEIEYELETGGELVGANEDWEKVRDEYHDEYYEDDESESKEEDYHGARTRKGMFRVKALPFSEDLGDSLSRNPFPRLAPVARRHFTPFEERQSIQPDHLTPGRKIFRGLLLAQVS